MSIVSNAETLEEAAAREVKEETGQTVLRWFKIEEVDAVIARENSCSGMHFDKCRPYLQH